MTGPGNLWILGESGTSSEIQAKTGQKTASGASRQDIVDGMGTMLAQGGVPGNPNFDKLAADWSSFDSDTAKVTYLNANMLDYVADGGWNGGSSGTNLKAFSPTFFADVEPNDVATFAFDAAITIGMAACDLVASGVAIDSAEYSGAKLYENILALNFTSVTGNVVFDETGSRLSSTGSYVLYNHRVVDEVTESPLIGAWTAAGGWTWTDSDDPFTFAGGTTEPPNDVEVPIENFNFVSDGLKTIGTLLVVINVIVAIVMAVLTNMKKKNRVIRASQPMFLMMILVGCIMSTMTIIPMAADDSNVTDLRDVVDDDGNILYRTSDTASNSCMMVPTLYSLGFVFSFSALFAKVTRIAKIFGNKKLAKVTITALDMIKPIIGMLVLDGIILLLWSMDEKGKLIWMRIAESEDQYGNPESSNGMCTSIDGGAAWLYAGIILGIHVCTLLYGNYMCYKARNAGTAFSESKYVGIAMVSNLQILALGLPILIIVYDNPTTNYFVRAGIIFMNDFGVMMLIFVPKFQLVFFGSDEDVSASTSTGLNTQTSGSGGATSDGAADNEVVEKLEQRIDELERELKEKGGAQE
jgi:hypothetical protein